MLLGLCDYIDEGIKLTFTDSSISDISHTTAVICKESLRQSERYIPYLGHFRKGLMSVKSFKAKDRFGSIFCVYLSLMNSYIICDLFKRKKSKFDDLPNTPLLSIDFLRGYFGIIEHTVMFHLWLKKDNYLKSDFKVGDGNVDLISMLRIKKYMDLFQSFVVCGGNKLKTPKFHQILYVVDDIERHGCPINYDGSCGENIGKTNIKDNAKRTNQ